ncbi:MAG: UvrD-helicase domain-containing protein [Clostridia bacterium]|nr:UvrD-helicase domain-containing protein [Clostridia bacterium]
MADVKWTPDQERAIKSRGNILVSAAAGSGKTATLSAKIMNLLRTVPDVSLTQFLIVTFTNAAAAELKERISREITKAASEDKEMLRHKRDVAGADICTIHSFCMKLIRRYFSTLDVSPDFSILDETTAENLKARAMEGVIDDCFRGDFPLGGDGGADIFTLADTVGKTRDAMGLDESMRTLAGKLEAMGYGAEKLRCYAAALLENSEKEFFDTPHGQIIRDEFTAFAAHNSKRLDYLMTEMSLSEMVLEKYMPSAAALKDYLDRIAACRGTYENMRDVVLSYEAVPLSSLSAKHKTDASEEFQVFRKEVSAKLTKLTDRYFSHSVESVNDAAKRTSKILVSCADVISEYRRRYTEMKRERGALDFTDLEELSLKLLVDAEGNPTREALEIGERYRFVFIDEYQDTNFVQDTIFRAVSGKAERFFVGDIKQSIYRFRGAEPEVFSGYRRAWSEDVDDETSHDGYPLGHSIFMSENFRCAEPVIEFANAVSRYMFPYGGIPFSEADCLRYGGVAAGDVPTEVCLIDHSRNAKGSDSVSVSEAEYVSHRIYRLIKEENYKPSDIAIILRSANTSGGEFEAALKEKGIPVKRVGGSDFAEEPEVMLCLNILRTVTNPMKDISLAGAMFSSVFGFSMEQLTMLRLGDGDRPLYASVERVAAEDTPLGEKCRNFITRLGDLRRAERGMSADRFIEHVYAELKLFDAPEVRERLFGEKHLRMLHELARSYEAGGFGGLYGFLGALDDQLEAGQLTTEGKNDENGVTIVSIHKSKGLEYRLCFLSECGKERNTMDEKRGLLFDKELGIGLRLPDPGGLVLCGNLIREALCLKMAREAAMEEMRTLYVAMTRAKERLIVTANTNVSPEEELSRAEKLSRFTDEYQVLHASRMIDIILRSLATDSRAKPIYTVIHKDTELERGESVSFEEKTAELSASPEEISRIRRNIGFVYPGAHMVNIPSKLSVSALYPTILDGEDESVSLTLDGEAVAGGDRAKVEREAMPRPRFMTGEAAVSGADRGTATHVFLQFADMERVRRDGVKRELERLVECGFVTAGMAALVNRAQAEHFAFSGIVTRMLASRKCMREFRFNVRLPAENFTDDEALKAVLAEGGEKLTVQGVFDCVFEDGDGKLVLVDYKTDYITPEEMNNREAAYRKLRERHSRQLGYYKEAVRLIFGRYPDETYLYSLPLGETVSI